MGPRPVPMIICGPSGVGKSVLIKKLQEIFPNKFGFSVSHTTRDPRPGEQDGKDYHFSTHEVMEKGISEGKFIEHAHVHGNIYGTSKDAVDAVRNEGKICILDIDVQGAKSMNEQKVLKRLANAKGEIEFSKQVDFFDYNFVMER